jgi:hypothetical protein
MSFIKKILQLVSKEVADSYVEDDVLRMNGRSILITSKSGLFDVKVFSGWRPVKTFEDVFATDLFDTVKRSTK